MPHSLNFTCHQQQANNQPGNIRQIVISLLLISALIVLETFAGLISGALVLLSEAAHLLTDFVALLLTYLAYHFSSRPSSPKYSFGLHRLQIIAAFINSGMLITVSLLIIYEALKRCFIEQPPITHINLVFFTAVLSLIVNTIILVLLQSSHDKSLNTKSAILHIIGDLLGSLAIIISAIVISTVGWKIVDPIISIFIVMLIFRSTYGIFTKALHILLEGTPTNINYQQIRQAIAQSIRGCETSHIHVWALNEKSLMATLHVKMPSKNMATPEITAKIRHLLRHSFGINHATIEMEFEDKIHT
jgi:cobalt-zinc-cadmium efflux system protein